MTVFINLLGLAGILLLAVAGVLTVGFLKAGRLQHQGDHPPTTQQDGIEQNSSEQNGREEP